MIPFVFRKPYDSVRTANNIVFSLFFKKIIYTFGFRKETNIIDLSVPIARERIGVGCVEFYGSAPHKSCFYNASPITIFLGT